MILTHQDIDIINKLKNIQQFSYDPDRQVGVIITDANGNIIETGSNRPPEKFGFDVYKTHEMIQTDPSWKYYMLEHAERNAIFTALKNGYQLAGATMYGTLYPCSDCARAIVISGIVRVVVPVLDKSSFRDQKWEGHYNYAKRIFNLARVQVDTYQNSDLL